jgi:ribosome modulation factor
MFYDRRMADQPSPKPPADRAPAVVRVATWIGRTVGRWQRSRLAKKNDAYVLQWKTAWSAGRDARWAGASRDAVPHRRRAQRDAWLAGWLWADTQADHKDAKRRDGRS